jgi:hypothetical protein
MDPKDIEMMELQFPKVPRHTLEALDQYWRHGYQPGSFLLAVLYGDLFAAATRADKWNKDALGHIAVYVAHEAPRGSWGNEELVKDWCNRGKWFQHYERQRLVDILSTE